MGGSERFQDPHSVQLPRDTAAGGNDPRPVEVGMLETRVSTRSAPPAPATPRGQDRP
jgi:hypothetical protein